MRNDRGAMRRESSEQRRGSATVTNHRFPIFLSFRLVLRACTVAMLLAGTAACATWTGSVGAILGKDNVDGRLLVREAPAGMGAARAGIEVGDEVVAIDGKPIVRMSPSEVHEALGGKVGTKVRVTVVRGGASLEFVVERGPLAGT